MELGVSGLKALAGVLFGILMTIITPLIKGVLTYPVGDGVLLAVFFLNYLAASLILQYVFRKGDLKKGVMVFYGIEFASWIVTYEAYYRLFLS